MNFAPRFLNASEAASRLGISPKALRLYEQRGMLTPLRTEAGWRAYGPDDMTRAAEIAALRALGFSLAQVARILKGDIRGLDPALAAHQTALEARLGALAATLDKVRSLRSDLVRGDAPSAGQLARLLRSDSALQVAFDLPWPWDGERFELHDIAPLTYITGPLGSGKTRLAKRLAEALGGEFLGLDRTPDDVAVWQWHGADPDLRTRVDHVLADLAQDGATKSAALVALLAWLEASAAVPLVVDLVEQGLDKASQEALIAHLRRRGPDARPLFLLTRSSAILDLDVVRADETILYCPANHSVPMRVLPYPGAPGYEALASCLASPEVRARTEGTIAWRPAVA